MADTQKDESTQVGTESTMTEEKSFVATKSTTKVTAPLGFFKDAAGDNSSGRLVKILSFVMACIVSIAGGIAISLIEDRTTIVQLSDYCIKMSGMFLGVAGGAELVQKLTKS